MQRNRRAVAKTWYRTAERDLRVARAALEIEASLTMFHAQQAAAKALKAMSIVDTDDQPRTHAAGRLMRELRLRDPSVSENLGRDAAALDLFYLTSRYPDTLGDEDPGDIFVREDGEVAVARAERILTFVKARLSSQA